MHFNEYVAIQIADDEDDEYQVFVNIQEDGKIKRVYCWADAIPTFITYSDVQPYVRTKRIRTTSNNNNIFRNVSLSAFIANLHRFVVCLNDEDDHDKILEKAQVRYKRLEVV